MKFIYILLIVLMSLTTMPIKAQENYQTNDPPIVTDKWKNTWLSFNYEGIDWNFLRFHYRPFDVDAYCIEHGVEMYPDSDYTVKNYDAAKLKELAKIYGAVIDLGNGDIYYMAAQLMIWEMFGHPKLAQSESNIKKATNAIKAKIKEYDKIIKPELSFKEEVKLGKVNVIEDKNQVLAKGYEIDKYTNGLKDIKIINNEIQFKVADPNLKEFEISVKPSDKLIAENQFNHGKVYIATSSQTLFSYNAEIPVNYGPQKINHKMKSGSLIIEKYDDLNHVVNEDVGIDIYTCDVVDNNLVPKSKINNQAYIISKGKLRIDNLSYGSYMLKEVSGPQHLEINPNYLNIEIGAKETKFKLVNKIKYGELLIEKYDNENNLVKDPIEVDLYSTKLQNGKYIKDQKLNQIPYRSVDGVIKIKDLKYGQYIIEEVNCPSYMVLNNEPINIDINTNSVKYKLVNKLKYGKIIIDKYDSENHLVKEEVAIELYDSKTINGKATMNQKLGTYKSINGQVEINDLKYGTYFIKEVSCPAHLELNPNIIEIKLDKTSINYKLINNFKKSKLIITKYDSENNLVKNEIGLDL